MHPSRQRRDRRGDGGTRRRAPDRDPQGVGVQRHPQRPPPGEQGAPRRVRPGRDARDGRSVRHVAPPEDAQRLLPRLLRVVGVRHRRHGPQGPQPPERRPVLHRQRDPRHRRPDGCRPRTSPRRSRPRARRHPLRDQRREPAHRRRHPDHHRDGHAVARRGFRSDAEASEENTGVNTLMQRLREALPRLLQSEEVAQKLDEPYSYLDVAGYNYADSRYDLDADECRTRDGGYRDPQHEHRPELAEGARTPPCDRRLHVDRMGLPRRGRSRPGGVRRGQRPAHGRLPVAGGVVRRHRHHRWTANAVLPPRDRLRAAHRASHLRAGSGAPRLDPDPRGIGRRAVARGPGLVVVARLGRSPDHGRRPERRRRGGAARQRHLSRTTTGR